MNSEVDYAFLLSPPAMRTETVAMTNGAAAYRAAFRALLCEDEGTRQRLEAQAAHIERMKAYVAENQRAA